MIHCYLILATNAPNYRPIHAELGECLKKHGNRVIYAVTSLWPDFLHPDHPLQAKTYDFSSFFADPKNYQDEPLPRGDIWKMFFPDLDRFRTIGYNRGHRLDWYQSLTKALSVFFRQVYSSEQVDFVVYEGVACSFSYFAYEIAKQSGAIYLGINISRLPARFEIHHDSLDIKSRMSRTYQELCGGQRQLEPSVAMVVTDYIDNIIDREPDYMKPNQFLDVNPITKYAMRMVSWAKLWRTLRFLFTGLAHPYETGNLLDFIAKVLYRDFLRPFKAILSRRYMDVLRDGERFFLYPIHFHPEASTSIYAAYLVDELNTIRNIALALPIDAYLYVKEHRSAAGYPSLSFYQEVAGIPNVRLLPAELNAKHLIRLSDGVITLTSTMGYEAIILGKQVFALGDCFYDFHPLVCSIRRWEDLAVALRRSCPHQPSHDDSLAFVGSYWLNTWPGVVDYQFESPPKVTVNAIVDALIAESADSFSKT